MENRRREKIARPQTLVCLWRVHNLFSLTQEGSHEAVLTWFRLIADRPMTWGWEGVKWREELVVWKHPPLVAAGWDFRRVFWSRVAGRRLPPTSSTLKGLEARGRQKSWNMCDICRPFPTCATRQYLLNYVSGLAPHCFFFYYCPLNLFFPSYIYLNTWQYHVWLIPLWEYLSGWIIPSKKYCLFFFELLIYAGNWDYRLFRYSFLKAFLFL